MRQNIVRFAWQWSWQCTIFRRLNYSTVDLTRARRLDDDATSSDIITTGMPFRRGPFVYSAMCRYWKYLTLARAEHIPGQKIYY